MTTQAEIAIRAASNWRNWGRAAAIAYARNRGVSVRLVALARQLHVAAQNGF